MYENDSAPQGGKRGIKEKGTDSFEKTVRFLFALQESLLLLSMRDGKKQENVR